MGSVFKKSALGSTEKAQPASPPSSYVNQIGGYEQVPVKNDDGSITYITRELPLSQEDELKKSQLDKMASDALAEIQLLSSPDYVSSISNQQLLYDWQKGQKETLNEKFDSRKQSESDLLAKRGLSNSTAANTVTRQTKQDEYDANKQIERETSSIATSLRKNELNNQQNLYNLAQNQINYDQASLNSSINGNLSAINTVNATNAASINDYYNRNTQTAQNNGMFINSILDPLTEQTGSAASDGLSAGVDGFISTITGSFLG